jgi:AcrR family transcriptional regulator
VKGEHDGMPGTAETAPPRGFRKGRERRAQILDRMIKMVATRGVDASSMRSVADALGVTHTALRHYFSSRDELLVAVYQEHEARETSIDTAGPAVARMQGSAARNRSVPGLVELYTTLASDAVQGDHPVAREFMKERFRWLRSEVTTLVRADQEAGRIRRDLDPVGIAALLIAASDGLQAQWLLDPATVDTERVLRLFGLLVADTTARGGAENALAFSAPPRARASAWLRACAPPGPSLPAAAGRPAPPRRSRPAPRWRRHR